MGRKVLEVVKTEQVMVQEEGMLVWEDLIWMLCGVGLFFHLFLWESPLVALCICFQVPVHEQTWCTEPIVIHEDCRMMVNSFFSLFLF